MKILKKRVVSKIKDQFRNLFDLDPDQVQVEETDGKPERDEGQEQVELSVQLNINEGQKDFSVFACSSREPARILSWIDSIRTSTIDEANHPVLLVVPYMPEKGRETCDRTGISWLDLSGNAHINEPPILVHIDGKDNQFKKPGRPRSVFTPKSSMISMHFLLHPGSSFTVKALADATGVDKSTVSRVTRKLESLGFIQLKKKKGRAKPYKLKNPLPMLDAWVEDYDFYKNETVKASIPESGGDGYYYKLREVLDSHYYDYSISGPRAANFYEIPAESSLAVAYVGYLPTKEALKSYGFHPGDRGANLWLTKPASDVVYMGTKQKNDLPVVNPILLYLDLTSIKAQRSDEAADHLYSDIREKFENEKF